MSLEKRLDEAIRESEAYRAELTRLTMFDNLIEMTRERKLQIEKNNTGNSKMQEMSIRHLCEVAEELSRARNQQTASQAKRQQVEALTQRAPLFDPLGWIKPSL